MIGTPPIVGTTRLQLVQVIYEQYSASRNSVIKKLSNAGTLADSYLLQMKCLRMDSESPRIVGYYNAAFTSNADLMSQAGYIAPLIYKNCAAVPITIKGYKPRRMARSVLHAEVTELLSLTNNVFAISLQLRQALASEIQVHLLTDVKCLSEIICKSSPTYEKSLILDTYASKQAYKNKQII